ncbi:hypothetical protein ACFU53_15235 [Streptomyces sp. NPDC057474]|uniref:hypothetical protein n=1 Tax=Streptomyces sp. NPDC057474 TaxID=3346144 RepID=UPI00368B7B00
MRNYDLLTQRPMPRTLYRGDSRQPYVMFRDGFWARGSNNDIRSHVHGDRHGNSNYVSTSGTEGVTIPFARSQGMNNLAAAARRQCDTVRALNDQRRGWVSRIFPTRCNGQAVTAETFVYLIDPRVGRNAVYVPDQIRGDANLYNHYRSQDEWAYIHRIPREAIMGVRVFRMTARAFDGVLVMNTIDMRFNRFMPNPNYGTATIVYNPNNDGSSRFNVNTDLNTPTLAANPYTRGCSSINRCRR